MQGGLLERDITPCTRIARRDFHLVDSVNSAQLKQQVDDVCCSLIFLLYR